MTFWHSPKLFLVVIATFVYLSTIFTTVRFSGGTPSILQYFKSSYHQRSIPTLHQPMNKSIKAAFDYMRPPQLPPVFTATPLSLVSDAYRLTKINRSRHIQDAIVKNISPNEATFENVILPLAHNDNRMAIETNIISFYHAVTTSHELRNAVTEAKKLLDEFDIDSSGQDDLFRLMDVVMKEKRKLEPESQRLLEKYYKLYIEKGISLPASSERIRFKEIQKRLSEINAAFETNLNEVQGGLWFTREDLDGVPEYLISSLQKGEGENKDKIWLTFKHPDLLPALRYANHAETRMRIFVENENKCNQNVPLFREAILLRDEAARLLGYNNHAEFRLDDKMVKTPKIVHDFLDDLWTRLAPGGTREIETLLKLKHEDLKTRKSEGAMANKYFLWDHPYYDRLLLEQDYQVNHSLIAEYFPIQTTIHGMLRIFEELFGLVFFEIVGHDRAALAGGGKGSDIVWHEDVQIFSVWNDEAEGSGFVGYLYLDLFPRDGKYGHAANFNLQPGYIDENGKRRYPVTALVCNFAKPMLKQPSLLKHDEVVMLFHELGHGIHDLVSRTTYAHFHGTSTVRDFVETPSQMLENWCWASYPLQLLSCHYSYLSPEYEATYKESAATDKKPSKRITDSLVTKLISTKHVNDAISNLRQLHFSFFDMALYTPDSHNSLSLLDITSTYNKLRKYISQLDGPESIGRQGNWTWGNGQAIFGHLIDGYDAGYYGYLLSKVYSTDMFHSVFKDNPLNSTEGRRYRHTILEPGGSKEEMDILEEFLGRKPSTEAFYRELGISW